MLPILLADDYKATYWRRNVQCVTEWVSGIFMLYSVFAALWKAKLQIICANRKVSHVVFFYGTNPSCLENIPTVGQEEAAKLRGEEGGGGWGGCRFRKDFGSLRPNSPKIQPIFSNYWAVFQSAKREDFLSQILTVKSDIMINFARNRGVLELSACLCCSIKGLLVPLVRMSTVGGCEVWQNGMQHHPVGTLNYL